MVIQVNMHEAKSQLSKLAEAVLNGERVIIARSGEPLLELVPHRGEVRERSPGYLKGKIRLSDDFNGEDISLNELFNGETGEATKK